MTFVKPNSFLKNAISLSKNPAFEVIVCSSELITFPFESTTDTVNVVSPFEFGETLQVVPSAEMSIAKLSFDASHLIDAPAGRAPVISAWRIIASP